MDFNESWAPRSSHRNMGIKIHVLDANNKPLDVFSSVSRMSEITGTPRSTLSGYINRDAVYESSYFGQGIKVYNPLMPMKSAKATSTHADYGPIQGIDVNSLELGYYHTFNEDLTLYKKFPTYTSLIEYFGNHNLQSWLNKNYAALCTVVSTGEVVRVYCCRNPNSLNPGHRQVYVVDHVNNTKVRYNTVREGATSIGMPKTTHPTIQRLDGSTRIVGLLRSYLSNTTPPSNYKREIKRV